MNQPQVEPRSGKSIAACQVFKPVSKMLSGVPWLPSHSASPARSKVCIQQFTSNNVRRSGCGEKKSRVSEKFPLQCGSLCDFLLVRFYTRAPHGVRNTPHGVRNTFACPGACAFSPRSLGPTPKVTRPFIRMNVGTGMLEPKGVFFTHIRHSSMPYSANAPFRKQVRA